MSKVNSKGLCHTLDYHSLSKICQPPKIHPPPIFAASYCKGSFITRKYAHPTNQNNR